MSRQKNIGELKQWVGVVPENGKPLGLVGMCFEACALMSSRSVDDVEGLLDVLGDPMVGHMDNDNEFQLPPPEYNWQLHGTPLWRRICTIPRDAQNWEKPPENWEYVGALALYCLRKAINALRREPIGLGLEVRAAGPEPQRLVENARYWLSLADKEKRAPCINTGRKIRAAGEKGNASRHKGDQKQARAKVMVAEAKQIRQRNPLLSLSAVAEMISARHKGSTGFGQRTIYNVLKKDL